jgi:hypothetical protein
LLGLEVQVARHAHLARADAFGRGWRHAGQAAQSAGGVPSCASDPFGLPGEAG